MLKIPTSFFTSRPKPQCRRAFIALAALGMLASTVHATDTYPYRGVCPDPDGGKRLWDKWYFWQCECTSYSAYRVNATDGVPLAWGYKDGSWGNASNWLRAAQITGTPYSRWPRRGDVAWFSYGHVAFVDAVDSYGDVTISEYNWGVPHDYHTRTIKRGTTAYPSCFIHFGPR